MAWPMARHSRTVMLEESKRGAISTSSEETEDGILVTRRFFLGSCTFCNT